jgi:hypothetical protein
MDVTTVQCGTDTRDRLREYRDDNDLQNYDEAIRDLLNQNE